MADLASTCKDKLAYFRIKELKDILHQLGLPRQGEKQDLVDRVLALLSDEQGQRHHGWGRRYALTREAVAKIVDDTYRKMQVPEAKVRCLCNSTMLYDNMIKCEDANCQVWQHMSCVLIPDKPTEGAGPDVPLHFYCELCRLNRADPFWVTTGNPLLPVKFMSSGVGHDGTSITQSVEKTFQLSRQHRETIQRAEYDLQAWCILINDTVQFRMQWPQYAELQVNGYPIRVVARPGSELLGINGRDDGPLITAVSRDGINKICLSRVDARTFCFGVRIVRRTVAQASQRYHELQAPHDCKNSRHVEIDLLEGILDRRDEPSNLKLPLLEHITENFSSACKIGRGGCGEVYKGTLPNGKFVAVKKLFKNHTMDDKMFEQEVKSMMMVRHQNIVRFLGYCSDTQGKAVWLKGKIVMADDRERLLCFEYISNGSLTNHLADELRGFDWCARYKIIKGVCEGLDHLHNDKGIFHMDLKPDNILVDDKMMPKITDFGLARTDGKTHTMSTERLGSAMYCAPEYRFKGKMSNKSDIYSLGFIIIELVTGSTWTPNITKVLGRWWHRWNKSLEHKQSWHEQVKKCLELALQCIHHIPTCRPSISDIIRDLNEIDNRNGEVRGEREASYEEVRPYLEAMLGIEPLEIHFPFALDNMEISCSIELTNDTVNYIAFMVSTTSLRRYKIQPVKDNIPPRSKCCVTIALQAKEKARLHGHSKEEFYVHSTRVDETLTSKDITENMFHEKEGKVVNEVNLPVVFDGPSP